MVHGKADIALVCLGRVLHAPCVSLTMNRFVASAGVESVAERYTRSIVSEIAVRHRM